MGKVVSGERLGFGGGFRGFSGGGGSGWSLNRRNGGGLHFFRSRLFGGSFLFDRSRRFAGFSGLFGESGVRLQIAGNFFFALHTGKAAFAFDDFIDLLAHGIELAFGIDWRRILGG